MDNAASTDCRVPFYEGHGVTLYCGRSEQLLPLIKDRTIDCLISDPPYGTTNIVWDKPVDWKAFWIEAMRICKPSSPHVLFASGKFVIELIKSNEKQFRYELIWEKNNPVGFLSANQRPLRSHENILVFSKIFKGSTYNPQMIVGKPHTVGIGNRAAHYGKTSGRTSARTTNLYHPKSILRIQNRAASKSLHPTQKPLELMKWLVSTYSHRGDTILDPYAGSGSTLVAAAALGRKAIGIEQSEEYCATIAERLERGE